MKTEVKLKVKKSLTIEDLKSTDHIGIVDASGERGFAIWLESRTQIISFDGQRRYYKGAQKVKEAIELALEHCCSAAQIIEVYKFDTRKELYQWLAE